MDEILKQLAEYDDAVKKKNEAFQTLRTITIVKLLRDVFGSDKRIAEICAAEREGRLRILPCKVGDTLYDPKINEKARVYNIETFARTHAGTYVMRDFGKTVFLTEPAARAAMEKEGEI